MCHGAISMALLHLLFYGFGACMHIYIYIYIIYIYLVYTCSLPAYCIVTSSVPVFFGFGWHVRVSYISAYAK